MANEWYFQAKGRRFGPISTKLIKQQVEAGRVLPDTLVRKGEEGDWLPAGKVRGLIDTATPEETDTAFDALMSFSNEEMEDPYQSKSSAPPPPPAKTTDSHAKAKINSEIGQGRQGGIPSLLSDRFSKGILIAALLVLILIDLSIFGILTFGEIRTRGEIRDTVVHQPQWEPPLPQEPPPQVLPPQVLRKEEFEQPHWEYTIESPSDLQIEEELDRLGAEGWELVAARRATSSISDNVSYEMIFKRRRSAAEDE